MIQWCTTWRNNKHKAAFPLLIIIIIFTTGLLLYNNSGGCMTKTQISVDNQAVIGEVPRELFSSFIEHIGRAIYTGIYQPEHHLADEDGFRTDVISLVKELNVPYVRYPGGNFVSGYNWKNGIGDKAKRPVLPDLAWKQLEPNQVGVDEFITWAEKVGAEPVMAVNMGTGTPQEALELLEYCNGNAGYWADLRKQNGREEPYHIKYWCIGNEMDGEWQIGHISAEEYAQKAKTTARMMKSFDPSVKLIFCGSSDFIMPTFPAWDKCVMNECFDVIDYISAHKYYRYDKTKPEAIADFIRSCKDLDRGLTAVRNAIAEVRAEHNNAKPIYISLDEWNVWYMGEGTDINDVWSVGPRREENIYTSLDATVFASLFSTIINHCDNVKMACVAQLVNVIAPIYTIKDGGAIRQTIFYPYKLLSSLIKGKAFRCDATDTLQVSFVADEQTGEAVMLVCNLSDKETAVTVKFNDLLYIPYEQIGMKGSPTVKNTAEDPFSAVPFTKTIQATDEIILEGYSWNVFKLKIKK